MTRLVMAILASTFVAAATVAWIVSHGRREFPMRRYVEDDDGVQPWEALPLRSPSTAADSITSDNGQTYRVWF